MEFRSYEHPPGNTDRRLLKTLLFSGPRAGCARPVNPVNEKSGSVPEFDGEAFGVSFHRVSARKTVECCEVW